MRIESASISGSAASNKAAPGHAQDVVKLREACKDFEAIFLGYLLKSMRQTVSKGGLINVGLEGDIFQEMLDAEICKAAANTSATGIAEMIWKQLVPRPCERIQHNQCAKSFSGD